MIKNFLLGSLLLLSLHGFAQEGTASPYSFYGIGDVRFRGTVENKSMGGLGIFPDSIHLNMQNPASLSALKLTSFSVAGTYKTMSLNSNSTSENARRTAFDYLVLAFPVGKLAFSMGLMPFSSVGYKVEKHALTDTDSDTRSTGTGGVNKAFVAAGYQITPKLSAGIDLGYNFGQIKKTIQVFKPIASFGTRELNTAQLNGISVNAGLIYKTKFKKYDFVSSMTFSPSMNLRSGNSRNIAKITLLASGLERVWDSQDIVVADSNIKLPSRFTLGTGIGQVKKWFVGVESTFQGTGNYGNIYGDNATFENATKITLGGFYIPNYSSFSNYFYKVTYRAGLRHENTGLVVNSQSIKDDAFTFGLGLPVGGNVSNINVGLELGTKGTTNSNLVKENYFNVSIGLSLNDKWFTKRKFN